MWDRPKMKRKEPKHYIRRPLITVASTLTFGFGLSQPHPTRPKQARINPAKPALVAGGSPLKLAMKRIIPNSRPKGHIGSKKLISLSTQENSVHSRPSRNSAFPPELTPDHSRTYPFIIFLPNRAGSGCFGYVKWGYYQVDA